MQGRKEYQPKLFSTLNIESLIPTNHLLRKIDRALDLSFVRDLTANFYCEKNGRPSIDPELFLRMVLIGHLYGISSDRKLCQEIGYNLSYRWFCKLNLEDEVPDHSSLTRIRDRFGEKTFEEIFKRVVQVCIDKKLVKGESFMIDGSLIKANASCDSLQKRKPDSDTNKDDDDTPQTPSSKINKIKGSKISNETHVSASDPDATIAGKANQPKNLYYKVHESIDRGSRVIVDCHVTTGSVHESVEFEARVKKINERFNFKMKEMIADRGFGGADNIVFLRKLKIRPIIPLFSGRVGKGLAAEEGFCFDDDKKQYVCPAGKVLYQTRISDIHRRYVSPYKVCSACPRFENCVPETQRKHKRGKAIARSVHQTLYEWCLKREKTKLFKKTLNERMWKMEGVFAEAKNQHGLRRAKYRGKSKMQIQAYLIASVQNLKRLAGFVLWVLSELLVEKLSTLKNSLNIQIPAENLVLT